MEKGQRWSHNFIELAFDRPSSNRPWPVQAVRHAMGGAITNLGPRLAPPARSLFCWPSRQAHGITMATRFLCTVEAGPCPKDTRGAQRMPCLAHPNDPRPQRQSPAPALSESFIWRRSTYRKRKVSVELLRMGRFATLPNSNTRFAVRGRSEGCLSDAPRRRLRLTSRSRTATLQHERPACMCFSSPWGHVEAWHELAGDHGSAGE